MGKLGRQGRNANRFQALAEDEGQALAEDEGNEEVINNETMVALPQNQCQQQTIPSAPVGGSTAERRPFWTGWS